MPMRTPPRLVTCLAAAASLTGALLLTGCSAARSERPRIAPAYSALTAHPGLTTEDLWPARRLTDLAGTQTDTLASTGSSRQSEGN